MEPRRSRPSMPADYRISQSEAGMMPLDGLEERLRKSRNYWIVTADPAGHPHAMPVWGLWLEGAIVFSTDPHSRKGRNLAVRPEVVAHLESGDEAVIVEGRAERVTDLERLGRIGDAYQAKYGIRPDPSVPSQGVYVIRPSRAFTWLESDFPGTATRFDWDD